MSEIVVTGERVARTLRETASSVATFSGDTIDELAAPDRLEQLLQLVPNVQLGSGGEGPTIRGQDSSGVVRDLPAFLGGTRPRATIQIDGRAATYYELAFGLTSVWDVERVEVFRSPQTTTQGRNSIGGAIFVETNQPSFEWEGRVRMIAGDFATRQGSVAVSAPLIEDQLAVRLAGDIRHSRASTRITSAAVGVDPNRDDSELLRVKLRAEPAAITGLRADVTYVHGRSQMPQVEGTEQPFNARRNPNATYGTFRITVDSLTGRLSFRPSTSLGATVAASFGSARMRRFAPAGLGEASIRSRDYSAEPNVSWRPSPSFQVSGGLHFLRSRLDQTIDVTAQQFGVGVFADVQHSFGAFGEVTIKPAPGLTITTGLRYQRDHQNRTGAMTGGRADLPVAYDERFHAWLPKLSLGWDISEAVRIGALVQRAYNPGGLTINTARLRVDTFDAERLWDYELFARARLPGGKLSLGANAFYYDMRNAQRTQNIAFALANGQIAFAAEVDNAPRAWSRGLELDIQWRPSEALTWRGAIGLLQTRITRTLAANDPLLGMEFQRSPRFTASGWLDWAPTRSLRLTAQLRHNSRYFSDDAETASRRVGPSTTVDAKVSWTRAGWNLFAYARNFFDEFHLTYKYAPSTALATAGDRREIGAGIDLRF